MVLGIQIRAYLFLLFCISTCHCVNMLNGIFSHAIAHFYSKTKTTGLTSLAHLSLPLKRWYFFCNSATVSFSASGSLPHLDLFSPYQSHCHLFCLYLQSELNPFLTGGLVHPYLDESISSFRGFWWMLIFYCILRRNSCKQTA